MFTLFIPLSAPLMGAPLANGESIILELSDFSWFSFIILLIYLCGYCSELCGVSIPIALADMHDCEEFSVKKRRKSDEWCRIQEEPDEKILLTITKESMTSSDFRDQPRSPFCFFM